MSETQQNQNRPHLLLTMAMIVLETIFTFILKHDRVVSLQAKKFIDENIYKSFVSSKTREWNDFALLCGLHILVPGSHPATPGSRPTSRPT